MGNGQELLFNIRALNLAGFIPEITGKRLKYLILWTSCMLIPYFFIHLFAVVLFFKQRFVLIRAILTGFLINNGFQTIFKHLYLAYKRNEISNLLALLDHNPVDKESKSFQMLDIGMRLQSRKNTKRFSTVIFAYNAIAISIGVAIPLILNMFKIALCDLQLVTLDEKCKNLHFVFAYEFWFPIDPKTLPVYYYLIIWEILMIFVYISTNCTCDAFACSLMLAAAERCKMLARSASQCLEPGDDGAITPNMRAWAIYHQHYLKIVMGINTVMGPMLLMIHTFAVFNIITYLYFIFKFNDPTVVNIAVSVMGGFIIQIFIYATAGQKMLNSSKDLSTATLAASTFLSDDGIKIGPARTCLQILSVRCSGTIPETFHGMGFFTIGMDLFTKVMSASLTYLLVIIQLCNCTGRISYDIKNSTHTDTH